MRNWRQRVDSIATGSATKEHEQIKADQQCSRDGGMGASTVRTLRMRYSSSTPDSAVTARLSGT